MSKNNTPTSNQSHVFSLSDCVKKITLLDLVATGQIQLSTSGMWQQWRQSRGRTRGVCMLGFSGVAIGKYIYTYVAMYVWGVVLNHFHLERKAIVLEFF